MASRMTTLTDAIAPTGGNHPMDVIEALSERRRIVCDTLETLADDLCGSRSRQSAIQVLDFITLERFGVPDDRVTGLLSVLQERLPTHQAFDELSELLEFDPQVSHRLERAAADGLEAIVLGRMPENPLDFILAAFSLVELERRYQGLLKERLLPLALAELTPSDWKRFQDSMEKDRDRSAALTH